MTITPQIPAEGISKRQLQLDDAESFIVECECTSDAHAVEVWIEIEGDDEFAEVEVTFYVDTYVPVWNMNVFERVKTAFAILFGNAARRQHSILLKPQAAQNWVSAMQTSIDKLEKQVGTDGTD